MLRPKIIAFYLPQFHPIPENDEWWGKGFTEWTNVGKAIPLFKGHYQPHVPADLGYYDLRLPEVREAQAELAKEAGIDGFCYYHYWFGNGKQMLEFPFNEVLRLGKPDFPFCLCWANESWHSKFWNKDGTVEKKPLVLQEYGDEIEWKNHFYHLLPAFKDERYIKIDGKPLFMIYRECEFEKVSDFMSLWNKLAKENDLSGIYFVAQLASQICEENINKLISKGFDAVNTVGLWESLKKDFSLWDRIKHKFFNLIYGLPKAREYEKMYPRFISSVDYFENVYPTLIPNWDHTPRSGSAGYVLLNSTPELFQKHVRDVFAVIQKKTSKNKIVFLKSWNEWGEGNYMEPDLKYGKGYIETLKNELDNL